MSVYVFIVLATLILGLLMPQQGEKRKYYIVLMAVIHAFILGFRYQYLTGDLLKYQWNYAHLYEHGWFSEHVLSEGRNTGFNMLMKLVALLFNNQFQPFLVILAIFSAIVVAVLIYRYSPAPWMSYLIWNCLGFYIFGFSAIKQALAMNFVMLAFIGIAERKLPFYLVMMALAGFLHTPALIFLPAYWLARQKISLWTVLIYVALGVLMNVFKDQFVDFIMSFYYEEDEVMIHSGELGNRFIMICLFCVFGILFKGFQGRTFTSLFHIMAVAAILQMLSGFNNIFTRLADYYFQLSILYIPMVFFEREKYPQPGGLPPVFPFTKRSLWVMAIVISLFLLWFYSTYIIGVEITYEVDNYLNYRFMWDVK